MEKETYNKKTNNYKKPSDSTYSLKAELQEITAKLETGTKELFQSENYKHYLDVLSKFHDYSFNNTLLISAQFPEATHVAGYTDWKVKFNRQVKKGEKGIRILAPTLYKVDKEMPVRDEATGKPLFNKDGTPKTEVYKVEIKSYKPVSVFDISQTHGDELPEITHKLTGEVDNYKQFISAISKASPVPIRYYDIKGSANGYFNIDKKYIAIQKGMSEQQTVKTAIHEISHSVLHDKDTGLDNKIDLKSMEVEAESVAYTVCQHYGIDPSDYSFGYIAGWSSGKDLKELTKCMETIRDTANMLITDIDKHFLDKSNTVDKIAENIRDKGLER
ncbi:MAG: hypothetical protein IJ141_09705 [Lachnospiraceae bacterium]|nr:hypothetical protein [Lachnospiraceae bacterium]